MTTISTEHPAAVAVSRAIHAGEVETLRGLLVEHSWLATARLGTDDADGMSRSLLHVATDWPGHYPNVADSIAALVAAGADVGARFYGPHEETPLHWAASNDDVAALDALLDAGADIEAQGAVLGGGSPLADATGFKQWQVANRLVARGAQVELIQAAMLGLLERVRACCDEPNGPEAEEITEAFWGACHGGRLHCAQYLLARSAELDWIPPWENRTPLDAALRDEAHGLVRWLRERGASAVS